VILGVAALGCAVLLLGAAGAGPVPVVGELHGTSQEPSPGPAEREVDDEGDGQDRPVEAPVNDDTADPITWGDDIVALVLALGALLVVAALVAAVLAQLGSRRPDEDDSAGGTAYDLETLREEIARAAEAHRRALDAGEIRDGIIACWVRLEEAAGRAGAPRSPADTPTEFVVRLLHALDVDPRAVAALAGLYHEARFSSHHMPADSRARARQALDAISRDLRVGVG
jgi:hypothetical protein